jgi:hypothetical protein
VWLDGQDWQGGGSTTWSNGSFGQGNVLKIITQSDNAMAALLRTVSSGDEFDIEAFVTTVEFYTLTLTSTFTETNIGDGLLQFVATVEETSSGWAQLINSITYTEQATTPFAGLLDTVVISGTQPSGIGNSSIATNGTNLFVIVTNNSFATSADGISWSDWSTLSSTGDVAWYVHYVNGQFVAMGNDLFSATPGIYYISVFNGTSWGTPTQMASGGTAYFSIAHNGSDLYIAVGSDGATNYPAYATSSNLTTWSNRIIFPGGSQVPGPMNRIIYQNNRFVTMGVNGYYYVRPDSTGIWSSTAQIPSGGNTSIIYGLAYSTSLDLYVGIGTNYEAGPPDGDRPIVTTSTNSTTWTARTNITTLVDSIRSIALGNGLFITVGNTNDQGAFYPVYYTSTNGVDWTRAVLNSPGGFADVVYGAGRFVAVGGTQGQISAIYSNIFS